MGVEELFQSVAVENTNAIDATITGVIPKWIEGSLYRNGPAKFEFGNTKYNHWFDGMAMLHRFKISKGNVTYQDRFIETAVYRKNMKANRIVCSEFGTMAFPDPCKTWYERVFSHFKTPPPTDNTCVNIFPFEERLYSATETNLIHRIDPETLESQGQVDLKKAACVDAASAHPHRAEDGSLYNMGTIRAGGPKYTIVKITPPKTGDQEEFCETAEIVGQVPAQWKFHPSYMHSFGITPNYFVFIEQPMVISVWKLLGSIITGKPFSRALQYYNKYPSKFHVIDRKTNQKVNPDTNYIADPFFTFHHINAYEENGQLVVDTCIVSDASVFKALHIEKLQAPGAEDYLAQFPYSKGARFVLPLDIDNATPGKNLVTVEDTSSTAILTMKKAKGGLTRQVNITKDILSETEFDFPQINYRECNGRKYRYVYGTGSNSVDARIDCITKLDVKTREMKRWREDNAFPSEPVFVASPDAEEEDDGVLLSMILTLGPHRSAYLLVLDARTMLELGRAEADVKISKDLHGCFVPGV